MPTVNSIPNICARYWALGLLSAIILSQAASAQMQSASQVGADLDQITVPGQMKRQPLPNQALQITPDNFADLRLGPGYLLQLEIYNTPEMTTALRVDSDGNVNIPLAGLLNIKGQSLLQAQDAIAALLVRKEILIAPQVTLNVLEYAATNVSVLGEVQSPGRIQLLAPKPLSEVIALAGGETITAGDDIQIQHKSQAEGETLHIHLLAGDHYQQLKSTLVQPGDTVVVGRAGIIYVLGAVTRPGGYLMVNKGRLNITQAVALANGTTLSASVKTLRIIRQSDGKLSEIDVPFSSMTEGKAVPTPLQDNDIVYVPTSHFKSILINGSSLLGAAASASIYRF